MPGRDLVSDLRESGKLASAPAPRGRIVDLVLAVVAAIAIGGAGYFGVTSWMSPTAPAPARVASIAPAEVWTDADTAVCKSRAIAAANAPIPDEMAFANRSVTEGYAGLSVLVECQLSTKASRFCDPKQKATAVAMVNDYLARTDVVYLGLGLQGAPMRLLGGVVGGEVAMGSSIYDEQRDQTTTFMNAQQRRVSAALQRLRRDGILAPEDFGGFLGGGVPKAITRAFGDVQPQRQVCS